MRNVDPEYHELAEAANIVEKCLSRAKERSPGERITLCGRETSWEDCLTASLSADETQVVFTFMYNIGADTLAVEERLDVWL